MFVCSHTADNREREKTDTSVVPPCMPGCFKTACSEVRRRRELELHVLSEPIRGWEGADMSSFGAVLYMSAASVQCAGSDECNDRYLVLFPNVLLLLSASPRMSGFIYQGKLPLTGLTVNKLEDMGAVRNAFEISGSMIERIVVCCRSFPQREEWTEHLQRQARGCVAVKPTGAPSLPSSPPASKLHESNVLSMNPGYHTLPVAGAYGGLRAAAAQTGGLAPAKVSQPWGLSSLRPAPPVRPSAALIYKEELSKSPKTVKKLLWKARKPSDEDWVLRKSTAAALEEDTQILKVIEAYCTSAKTRQTLNSTWQAQDLMHNHVICSPAGSGPSRASPIPRESLTSEIWVLESESDRVWVHAGRGLPAPAPRFQSRH
uniref:PH domain-containing protein n=1 Tax=Eptatretus burgeri TaxID=7764 RepID=A0A8C4R895_EPTBU